MDQSINHPRLHTYLGQLGLDTRSIEIESLVGGQSNPTYKIRCCSDCVVLRKKPSGKLLPSAHAIEREYRVMSALASTAVPVPKMLALCEDESLIGWWAQVKAPSVPQRQGLIWVLPFKVWC